MKYRLTFLALLFGFSLIAQSNSFNMEMVGSWNDEDLPSAFYGAYNEVWGYTDCDGNEYAILGSSGYVHFFDLSDPANPVEIDRFEGGDVTVWRDIKTYEDHVYTVCDGCAEGMMIFDLSNLPTEVIKIDQTTDFFSNCHNLFIDELHGRIYAAGTNTMSFGLTVLDIATNPNAPVLLAQTGLDGGYIHDLYVRDHIVYANSAGSGLYVYDFSDPEDVEVLGTMTDYEEQGYNHSGWLSDDGNTLVMMDETHGTGIKMVDVSNNNDITVESIFRSTLLAPAFTNSVGHNPYVRGDYAFISYYHDGVQVFDISDVENVTNVAYYDIDETHVDYGSYTGNWGLYPFLPSGLILASDMNFGLHVFNLTDISLQPATPATYPDVDLAFFDTTACAGESIELLTVGTATSYEWMNSDAVLPNTDAPSLVVAESGPYSVLASNQHCSVLTDEVIVNFIETATPVITEIYYGVLESSAAVSYQWYFFGTPIPGATEAIYDVTTTWEPGGYTVEITDEFGCTAVSEEFYLTFLSTSLLNFDNNLGLAPNPANSEIQLSWTGTTQVLNYQLLDITGKQLQTGVWNTAGDMTIPLSQYAAGMYVIQFQNESGIYSRKLIKE